MFKVCNEIKRVHLKARKKKRQFSLALHLEHCCGEKKKRNPYALEKTINKSIMEKSFNHDIIANTYLRKLIWARKYRPR